MLTAPFSFDDIMAPLGAERFFAEYEGQRPLHLKGVADKYAEVMTWAKLNDLLGQATIWTDGSLLMWLDREPIAPARYCASALSRNDRKQVLQPDPEKVKDFLRRGATMAANWIDHLSGGLTAFTSALEQALLGKVQANLYVSSRRRQGLASHRDRHDVYAVHVEGTKTWYVYEGRSVVPTAHPMFKTSRAEDEEAKGRLLMEVKMEPGDLLYLPRGQYHDALADEGGAMHIAFGVTYPNGLDVLSLLHERAVAEPLFRTELPRPRGPDAERAMAERLAALTEGLNRLLADRATAARIRAMQMGFHHPRNSYNLPELFSEPAEDRYRVRDSDMRLVQQAGRFGLVRKGSRAATEVPPDVSRMVGWVLEHQQFSRSDLAAAFPERAGDQIDRLLRDLAAMSLIEAV
ncbi:MAG TPA: cupin domain-containing protein [Geminicoccaceae bacterium]|nr:cupin domain-containing protein [Geminicoccaceae bacterium]